MVWYYAGMTPEDEEEIEVPPSVVQMAGLVAMLAGAILLWVYAIVSRH